MNIQILFFVTLTICLAGSGYFNAHGDPLPASDQGTTTIPFDNFTTLEEAIAGVEKYALHFNESLNFPALLFAFSVKGKTVFKKAWGVSDLENNLPANVENKFRIGSISKSFTAAVIGQLVESGKLKSFDDLVYNYLDEAHFRRKSFAGRAVNITLSQLLSHSAGLHSADPKADIFTRVDPPVNVSEQVKRFAGQPLHTAPGSGFEYANNGFQPLGAVIESVTGRPYQQVMTDFFAQYKFPAMLVGDSSKIIRNVPRYYTGAADPQRTMSDPMVGRNGKLNVPVCPYDDLLFLNGWWPAGGLVGTLEDLLHYGHLLIDAYKGRPGAILGQSTVKRMWSKHVRVSSSADSNSIVDYGYAWFISRRNELNRTLVYHAGGIMGVTAQLTILPEEEVVGVTFVNKGVVVEGEQMILYAVKNLYHLVK